jgi:hypothetical protein
MNGETTIHKVYCYVDETGQDTTGRFFLVSVVLTHADKDELERFLLECEEASGRKRGQKWMKSTHRQRLAFIDLAFRSGLLRGLLFYQTYQDSQEYDKLTVLALIEALNLYASHQKLEEYVVTVVIDGLKAKQEAEVAAHLRKAGVRVRRVRGRKDESNALLRLADFVAGMVRSAEEGKEEYARSVRRLIKEGILQKL